MGQASWPGRRTRDPLPGELAAASDEAPAQGTGWAGETPPVDLPGLIRASREPPHWQDVASRPHPVAAEGRKVPSIWAGGLMTAACACPSLEVRIQEAGEAGMRAQVGDRLMVGYDRQRTGLVIGVPREDGQPPYIIKWLSDGHIAMVFPDQYARIVPPGHPAGTGLMAGEMT
jgi:hypothetical protein